MMQVFLLLMMSLAGCNSVSETFDSSPGQGVGAKPITMVNHMVNEKQLKASVLPQRKDRWKKHQARSIGIGSVERMPEKTIHVWLAPHVDEEGNLHEASRVHTVLQPSQWTSQPYGEKPCFNE